MVSFSSIAIGSRITFELYPSAVFGYRMENVIFEGHVSPAVAIALGEDIQALHASVYNTLPVNTPDNPQQYNYIRVRNAEGKTHMIGEPYIREGSLIINDGRTLILTFEQISQTQVDRIFSALAHNNVSPTSQKFV